MAKSPIRKTIELLLKKVDGLENQVFAQRLHIDELEGKLQLAEEAIKKIKEDPFANIPQFIPYTAPAPIPALLPPPIPNVHLCQAGPMDSAGNVSCLTCGAWMNGTWTITGNNIILCQADPQAQTSIALPDGTTQTIASGVEEIDLDIIWDDVFTKIT